MEEKKTKSGQAQEKLSYEKLKELAAGLSQRNQMLERQLQSFDTTSFTLDLLFRVMDHKDNYDSQFVDFVKKNIQAAVMSFMQQFAEPKEKDENE